MCVHRVVYRPVYRCVYRHVCGHIYIKPVNYRGHYHAHGHVYGHVCRYVDRHGADMALEMREARAPTSLWTSFVEVDPSTRVLGGILVMAY